MRNRAEIDDVLLQQESARTLTQIPPQFMDAIARLGGGDTVVPHPAYKGQSISFRTGDLKHRKAYLRH